MTNLRTVAVVCVACAFGIGLSGVVLFEVVTPILLALGFHAIEAYAVVCGVWAVIILSGVHYATLAARVGTLIT